MTSFGDDRTELVPLRQARELTTTERALVDFLLAGPLGRDELREQAVTARVSATCSCGCPSVGLDVDAATPAAGSADWVPITAFERDEAGETQVTLHVLDGRLHELEIWAGDYGVRPRIDLAKLEHERE